MCGRFNQKLTSTQWAEVFDTLRMPPADYGTLHLRYNTAPMQTVAVIRSSHAGPELAELQWKLIPSWSKTPAIKFNTINAKAETIDTSGTFREPFKKETLPGPGRRFL